MKIDTTSLMVLGKLRKFTAIDSPQTFLNGILLDNNNNKDNKLCFIVSNGYFLIKYTTDIDFDIKGRVLLSRKMLDYIFDKKDKPDHINIGNKITIRSKHLNYYYKTQLFSENYPDYLDILDNKNAKELKFLPKNFNFKYVAKISKLFTYKEEKYSLCNVEIKQKDNMIYLSKNNFRVVLMTVRC
jgi:hypothetical protein